VIARRLSRQVAVLGVTAATGPLHPLRPPKNVDLALIGMLPIDELIVGPSTAAAIRQKVRRAASCAARICSQGDCAVCLPPCTDRR
jgi:hypothetical protein